MANAFYKPTGNPAAGAAGSSKDIRDEYSAVEDGFDTLNTFYFLVQFADLNTATSHSFVSPFAGDISRLECIIDGDNGTTNTVITAEIGGVAVTGGTALTQALGDTAGNIETRDPTGAKTVADGSRIAIITDGAGSTDMPGSVMVYITRTALT